MSDPIAEHLYSLGHWKDRKIVDRLSKQIRQQIGREINKVAVRRGYFLAVREVCQLEEK